MKNKPKLFRDITLDIDEALKLNNFKIEDLGLIKDILLELKEVDKKIHYHAHMTKELNSERRVLSKKLYCKLGGILQYDDKDILGGKIPE